MSRGIDSITGPSGSPFEFEKHGSRGRRRQFDDADVSEVDIDMDRLLEHSRLGGASRPTQEASELEEQTVVVQSKSDVASSSDLIVEQLKAATSKEESAAIMREAIHAGFVVEKNGSLYPSDEHEEEGGSIILALRANESNKSEKEEKPEEPKKKHEALRDGKELGEFKKIVAEQMKRVKSGDVEGAKALLDELVAMGFIKELGEGYIATRRDPDYSNKVIERFNHIHEKQKQKDESTEAAPKVEETKEAEPVVEEKTTEATETKEAPAEKAPEPKAPEAAKEKAEVKLTPVEEALKSLGGGAKKTSENQLLADVFTAQDLNQLVVEAYAFVTVDVKRALDEATQPKEDGTADIEIVEGRFVAKSAEGVRTLLEVEDKIISNVIEKSFGSGPGLSSEEKYAELCRPEASLIDRLKTSKDPELTAKLKDAILNRHVEFRADGTIEALDEVGKEELENLYIEIQSRATEKFVEEAYEAALKGFKEKDRLHYESHRYIAFEKENERFHNLEYSKEEMQIKKRLFGRGPELRAHIEREKYLAQAETRRGKLEAALAEYEAEMMLALRQEAILRANLIKTTSESSIDSLEVENYIEFSHDADFLRRYQRQNFKQADRVRVALSDIIETASVQPGYDSEGFKKDLNEAGLGEVKTMGLDVKEVGIPTLTELYEDVPESEKKRLIEIIQRELLVNVEANLDEKLTESEVKSILETNYVMDYIHTMIYEQGAIDRIKSESSLENKLLDLRTIKVLLLDVKKSELDRDKIFEKILKEAIAVTGKHQAEAEVKRLASTAGLGEDFDIDSDEVYQRIFAQGSELFEEVEIPAQSAPRRTNRTTVSPESVPEVKTAEEERIDSDIASLTLVSNDSWRGVTSSYERQAPARSKHRRIKGLLSLFGWGWLFGSKA